MQKITFLLGALLMAVSLKTPLGAEQFIYKSAAGAILRAAPGYVIFHKLRVRETIGRRLKERRQKPHKFCGILPRT
jgi:hypothetical protein